MRRLFPGSLAGWGLLVVIVALTVAEVTTLLAIAQSRTASTLTKGLFQLAERVSSVTRLVATDADPAERKSLAAGLGDATLAVHLEAVPLVASSNDDALSELASVLHRRLSRLGVTEVRVARHEQDTLPAADVPAPPAQDAGPVERALANMSDEYALGDAYVVSVKLADGSWLDFINTIAPPSNLWSAETIALTLGGILMVLVASTWALRQLTGPYSVLATAAERFGVDLDSPPLPETGPGEVRSAARAFNLMRDRLKRMVEDRDQMVAAVSHDIRTPVTRLRLRAEAIADPALRHPILADLHEIETMTQSVLALASDHAQPEPRQLVDLVSLVESLCADAPNVVLQLGGGLPPRIPIWAQPVEVRRCIGNVIANAVKYGRRAIVSLELAGGVARVIVDDEGPGIAPQELERIFRPFVRLESSRNRDTGGAGLGLTIARSVARSHGGDVTLGNRAGGGLRAIITLPRADEQRRAPGAGNVPMDARATARRGFIDADA